MELPINDRLVILARWNLHVRIFEKTSSTCEVGNIWKESQKHVRKCKNKTKQKPNLATITIIAISEIATFNTRTCLLITDRRMIIALTHTAVRE